MSRKEKYVTQGELKNLFHLFNEEANDCYIKDVTKLPYEKWKELKDYIYRDVKYFKITISLHYHDIWISTDLDSGTDVLRFNTLDRSFGTFLDNHWDRIPHKSDLTNSDKEDALFKMISDSHYDIINSYNSTGDVCYCSTDVDYDNLSLTNYINKTIQAYDSNTVAVKESEDNNIMNTFNFDFGPITNNQVHLSPYGMAIKNSQGTWVAYNGADVIDVDIFNFDAKKFLYKMPVAIKDIAVGDVVIHNRLPMFVVDVKEGIKVIDVYSGEKKEILLTKNMFGFDFATKVVSVLDFTNSKNTATADNPFGSMLPFFLLNNEKDMDPMALLLLTANSGVMGNSTMDFSNPFMLMALMGDKGNKNDMLLPLLLMNQQKSAPTVQLTSNP